MMIRCFINIIDSRHTWNYETISETGIAASLEKYITQVTDDPQAVKAWQELIRTHKKDFDVLETGTLSLEDANLLTEAMRAYKRAYLMKEDA